MSSWTLLRGALSTTASADSTPAETESERKPETDTEAAADRAAMKRIQAGDKQALGQLYDRYARLVLSIGMRILRDTSEAQELMQEVFLYVFRKSQDFDPDKGPFRTWLFQIAYSRAFNKREYLALRRFYDYRHIDDVLDSVPSDCSPETDGQLAELREVLREALGDLNRVQRQTLEMFFWDGYSLREISIHLKESLGNTRNHYYRGLEKLRESVKLLAGHRRNGGR